MKRILHISKYYYPFAGGVEQVARDCVQALDGKYEQRVICFDHIRGRDDSKDIIDNVEIIRCAQEHLIASQALGRTYGKDLKQVLNDFKPDLIIFHYPNPFVSHYLLKYISRDTKLIIWWHLDIYKQKILKYFFYGQNKRLLKTADIIVATSPNYIDGSIWLSSVKEKCAVIPNCINEDRLQVGEQEINKSREIKAANPGKIICLAVGRHVPYKGFEYLIKAANLLDDRFEVRIAGEGPLTDELHYLAENNKNIKFLGLISDEDLKANLLACDIFCFPSITKNEAFGLALAEGMYFGHPAVTFTIPGSGVNYVSLNRVTGIEVPNRDIEKFADAITELGDNKEERLKYGQAAHQRVMDNFTFKTFKNSVRNMINEL